MNKGFVELSSPMGGVLWKGDLVGRDAGYSTVKSFIEQHKHDGWTLSVFDELTKATIEVDCELSEMPQIVAYIYNIEHAAPMTFIGENPASESYVIGMTCTRGRFSIPGAYKAEDGKLTDLSAQ
ncbi:hypothetical protein [uncultured Slackia sp.]|uniref:hypothetical protein n=1 Tax=uncultured Slackia sp. TaxID=665903 RepID=UPI00280508A3|nr:hypothetical protein [uncultured Slackia sp.]